MNTRAIISIVVCTFFLFASAAYAQTPTLAASPPSEGFVGEPSCFTAGFTNSGANPGFGPYYQVVTQDQYTLSSASFVMLNQSITTVGVFPAAPGNQLTDPFSGELVTGDEGSTLSVVRYPIGSVVAGQPSLDLTLCIDVDSAAPIDVELVNAFSVTPAYELGDTPTGENGPIIGSQSNYNFTPVVIRYAVSNMLPEMENPPGPAWQWTIEVVADIASDRTVTPIDFSTVSPITLPSNVQFVGPVTFSGTGVSCTSVDPGPGPGGSVELSCTSGSGTIGDPTDIVAAFPVYIVDTLNETSCSNSSAINTAKHVTIQKTSFGMNIPDGTVTYEIEFQISEFVEGIDRLVITDVMPDGLTFVNTPTLTYNGGSAVSIAASPNNDSPSAGQTTVVYTDVTSLTGTLLPATSGTITYTATIDQTYSSSEPVRARDTLINTVTGEYDIADGISPPTIGASNCTDTSSETITVQGVASSKSIVGSSSVSPGDLITWRLRLDIPSGDVQNIVFDDYFPLPIFDVGNIDISSTDIDGTNTSISRNTNPGGDTFGQDPTAISVDTGENRLTIIWPDVSTTSGVVIEVDVETEVSSEPFADGLDISNVFQATTNSTTGNSISDLNIANITLREPDLVIAKTVTSTSTGLQAGDTVTFDIEVTNEGGAEAYDVTVTDVVPSELTSCVIDAVSGGSGSGDLFGAGYTFSSFTGETVVGALDPAGVATITVSCDLAITAENNSTYENTAAVVWAAQPGATAFPAQEATASISTAQISSFKSFVSTSEAHTPETAAGSSGDPWPVVAGEIIRYRAWTYLPQGTTANPRIRDLLPVGLEYVAGTARIGLVSNSGSAISSGLTCSTGSIGRVGNETSIGTPGLTLDCPIAPSSGGSGSGSDPIFSLGNVVNSEEDSDEELVVIEFNVRVINGQTAGTVFNNRIRTITNNGNNASSNNTVVAEYFAPEIAVTKQVVPNMADADDDVEYVITFQHATSVGNEVTAYDLSFTDVIQSGLVYDSGSSVTGPQPPASPGTDTCTATTLVVDDSAPSTTGITITFDELAPGDVCEVRYSATTGANVFPGQQITNTVDIDYSSLPGNGTPNGTGGNSTGSAPGTEDALESQASAALIIDTVAIVKSIVSTSDANTTDAASDTALDPRPVSIGEMITYRLQMRLPEGGAPSYIVTDNLPIGLQYLTGTGAVAFVSSSGGTITSTSTINCVSGTLNVVGDESSVAGVTPDCLVAPSGGAFASGTDLVWNLGDLTNTDSDVNEEFIVIEFDAVVVNESSNQEGTALSNTFDVSVDGVANSSAPVVSEVVEPRLTLTSSYSPDPVDNRLDATPTFSWTITLTNAGSLPAFQVNTEDNAFILPVGVQNISSLVITPAGNVFRNGTATTVSSADFSTSSTTNTNDTIDLLSSLQIAPGASLQITFDAELLASVEPGDTASMTEEVFYSGAVSGDSSSTISIRDDADQSTGTGNTPITSATNLNDYRTEVILDVVTEGENPSLSVTKGITAGPTNTGNGDFDLTYTIALANAGDVNLETVSILDNLDTTFGTGTYTINNITVTSDSTSLVENASFTGNGASTALLVAASSTLPATESGSIDIELTVTPAANLGPLTNTAVGSSVSERSGDAADDNGDVDVTFDEGAEIGLAKTLSAGPTNNNDGTYTLTYTFLLENTGDILLDNLQITDDLSSVFTDAISYNVDAITSSDFTVDTNYDGDSAGTNTLLTGTNSLVSGANGSVDVVVTVTPGADLGPYNNTALAAGDPPSDNTVTDTSDNGTTPDGNLNGDPTDDSDATPVTFSENPQIGVAKDILGAVINNNDGTYTLTYRILLANFGDVPLGNVQVTDSLSTVYADATSFSVDNVTSTDFAVNSAGYNGIAGTGDVDLLLGTDTLAVGASGTLDLTITVTPGTDLGPYNNIATGSANGPGGTATTDLSDAGAIADGGDADPSDDNDVTPVTFVESPEIGLAKQLITPIVNNGDDTYTLTYRFVIENSGDVPLSAINVTEDLDAVFADATDFTVNSVTSSDFTSNFPGFDGGANTNLLTGTDGLASGASGTIDLVITVEPGSDLGPYDNTATVNAISTGGISQSDVSDDGTASDENGINGPGDDSDVTPVTFVESPEIGLAKAIQGTVSNNNDGSYTFSYRFYAENSGDTPLINVQITDDLASVFSGATYTVDALTSSDFTVNSAGPTAFDGDSFQNMLAAGNTLATGAFGTVDLLLTVTPGTNLGPYNNTANVSAETLGGGSTNDVSDLGSDPDAGGNGPADDNDVTPITFTESPELGLAKEISAGPTNNLDGSYTLTYRLYLENSGDVPVSDIHVIDDLATVFADATSYSVDGLISVSGNLTPNFPGYDGDLAGGDANLVVGTDDFTVGMNDSLELTITVVPGTDLGPYDNLANANATSSGGNAVSDTSTTGSVPDANGINGPMDDSIVTTLNFVEGPAISAAKTILAGPTNNNDGTYTLTYRITISNSGDTPLTSVTATDDIELAFTGVSSFVVDSITSTTLSVNSAGYDGLTAGDINLLLGTDALTTSGATATGDVDVTLTVTPANALGPHVNTVATSGISPSSAVVSDTGNAPNITFVEEPELGIAKSIIAGPTNNADGTYDLTYSILLENSGDVVMTAVQVSDDLSSTFALADAFSVNTVTPSAGLTANTGYDGDAAGQVNLLDGTNSLAVGQTETVVINLTVTPGAILGPYNNTAVITGTSPALQIETDTSTDGVNPDANGNGDPTDDALPTSVSFAESPEIGLAKRVSTGPINNADGSYSLTYEFTLENSGDVVVNNLQVTDDLSSTFADATSFQVDSVSSTSLTTSGAFDGVTAQSLLSGTDSLSAGTIAIVNVALTVVPGADLGPYDNTATLAATSPADIALSDSSDDGTIPDGNGNNDPTDDSDVTSLTFSEAPELGLAKDVSAPINNGDGTYTLTYTFTAENTGDVVLNDLLIVDDLSTTFAGATSFTIDSVESTDFTVNSPAFNGISEQNLLSTGNTIAAGTTGVITLTVTVTPGALLGPYDNRANATSASPAGTLVADNSTAGVDPDSNSNGDPTDDSTPTSVTFSESPEIGLAKQVVAGPTNNADGTHTLTYRFLLENTGDVDVSAVQVVDNLSTTFTGATSFVVDSLSSTEFAVNPSFDGISGGDNTLLAGTDTLVAEASGTIDVVVTVVPGGNLGPYANTALTRAVSPAGIPVSDDSDDAAVVDENGNGDPADDSDPTNVTFAESPVLGIAKVLAAGPTNNGDGTYTLSYSFTVENSGDVNIENMNINEDLALIFNNASTVVVDSLTSPTLSTNAGFDGFTDKLLLNGADILGVDVTASVLLQITVTPGADLGPYLNTATVEGTTPAGIPISDDSVEGVDPDANGNDDPTDDASPTPVTFAETAVLGLAKAATESLPNFDGTFTTTLTLIAENLGDVVINNVVIADEVAAQIAPATVEAIENTVISGNLSALNSAFDGVTITTITDGTESLAVGESATIEFDLVYRPNDNLGPFTNIATVLGESPANSTPGTPNITDDSTDGATTDPDGNGDPTDDTVPTEIAFIAGTDGIVTITEESVPGESLEISVTDIDENFDSAVVERFETTVVNDMTGESEVVTVVETGPDTGVFVAQLSTIFGLIAGTDDDGVLNTQLHDTVTVIYEDRLTSTGGIVDRTDTGLVIGFAAIEGSAWIDDDTDDVFDTSEVPLDGWVIRLEQDGVLIAETPVDPDGSYSLVDLVPGGDYRLSLVHPDSDVTFGTIEDIVLTAEVTEIDQNMAIDPSGVFYDSVARLPVGDVAVSMINSNGEVLPASCLLAGQTNQVTAADGMYRFDILSGADAACQSGETYTIVFTPPVEFNPGISSLIPPLAGPLDPTGLGSPVRIGDTSTTPTLGDTTDYYLTFTLENGDPDVVFNHIPLDPVGVGGFSVRLIKDADQRTTSIGGLVSYTITIENLSTIFLPGVSILDSLPAGFSYVEGSAQVDGDTTTPIVSGTRPVTFAGIDLPAGERRVLRYVLRAGVGLVNGEYTNTATPFVGPAQIGNSDTALIVLIADPDFEQTSIIGKVWHDRDADGWQDTADANDVNVQVVFSEPVFAKKTSVQQGDGAVTLLTDRLDAGIAIPKIPGRYGLADESRTYETVIVENYSDPVTIDHILVETKEGTRLRVDADGTLSSNHRGERAKGLTSQDIGVRFENTDSVYGTELKVIVSNTGIVEQGLPGVRLATVEGLLIETDSHGRYHIAGVDAGFAERGRNFILKVDPATLPKTATFTTENPRVKRLSQGLMNRFDFGVQIPESNTFIQTVSVKLTEMFFKPDSAEVRPDYTNALESLAQRLSNGDVVSLKIQADVRKVDSQELAMKLAERRAQHLRDVLCEILGYNANAQIETNIELLQEDSDEDSDNANSAKLNDVGDLLRTTLENIIAFVVSPAYANCLDIHCQAEATDGAFVIEGISSSVSSDTDRLGDVKKGGSIGESVVRLKDGGVIWWTEDPVQVDPVLAISAPSHLPVRENQFTDNVEFLIYTNYASFFDAIRIDVFLDTDIDRRAPVATLDVDTTESKQLFYRAALNLDGTSSPNSASYVYVASTVNHKGQVDITKEQRIFFIDADLYEQQTVRPDLNPVDTHRPEINASEEGAAAESLAYRLTPESTHLTRPYAKQSKALSDVSNSGEHHYAESVQAPLNADILDQLLRRNDLIDQRIPIYGSRVRIQGNDVGDQHRVLLNDELIALDVDNSFAVEYLKPIGRHRFNLRVEDALSTGIDRDIDVDVTGRYQFMVALADFTLSSQDVSGSLEALSGDERYEEEMLTEGRLAFYLKGKIKGKYLITAQLDTQEEEIGDIFNQLSREDADSLFRRLDPDRYYPVYGDDSTTVSDVNTQGRMYLRVDWDRSEILWGNYETGFTGNEISQYSRGLYGAKLSYESIDTTDYDDSKTVVSAFVSESQTVLGHSEFLGTGGSLYYLRHTDILAGSDKVRVEVRDPDTNRVIDNITLSREIDYEIDELQGRIILTTPLLQTSQQSAPSLIVDGPLDGNLNILIVDYEYIPDGFNVNNTVGGLRAKQWLGDHIGVGITYVDEGRDAENYELSGLDVTLKAAESSWLKLELGQTSSTQTERMFSVDGGLSFANLSPLTRDDREGQAFSADLHVNAGDFGGSDGWTTNAWFKEVDDEYSVARRDDGNNVSEYGIETHYSLSEPWSLSARASLYEIEDQYELTEIAAQVEGRLSDDGTLLAELKTIEESRSGGQNEDALLLALQYEHRLTEKLSAYGGGQTALTKSDGYQSNDQLALGVKMKLTAAMSGQLEVREGDRGNGLLGSLERRLNDSHTVYATTTYSTDNTSDSLAASENGASMLDNVGKNLAVGHRWALNDRANLFTEMQYSRNDEFSGIGEVFGLDYASASGWHLGVTLQGGDLTDNNGDYIDRQAYSLSGGYQANAITLSSKLEFRKDQGIDDEEQWLTANRFNYKISETYRLAAKLNYSESETSLDSSLDGKLIEGSVGLARRPDLDDRFNWLAKYTYLHDLQSIGQLGSDSEQRSQIVSWEGIYRLNKAWDIGSKVARREGEIRLSRDTGSWFDSTVNFAAIRGRWHVIKNWDAMVEYRWLEQEEAANDRSGYLLTIDRHIKNNFKIGIGYNFTDFSDDLTDLDYEHEGWFLNVLGKY